ncbi:MAG: UvrD-helicase domain-containing protein [Polyangia bacterium]
MSNGLDDTPPSGRFLLARDRVVNAGAGTGKTHALLTQYLHLLSGLSAHGRPIEPRALGVLTFTDKAAGELRERLQQRTGRIVQRLAEARGAEPPDGPGDGPGDAPGDAGADPAQRLMAVEPDLCASAAALGKQVPGLRFWLRVREQLGGAPIGTFHSFSATLLRRYAAAAGLDPDFDLLDEDRARELRLLASEHVVLKGLEAQLGAASAEEVARLVSEYGFAGGPSPSGGLVEALCRLHAARSEEGQGASGLARAYLPESLWAELERLRAALRSAAGALGRLQDQLGGKSAETLVEVGELCAQAALELRPVAEAAADVPSAYAELAELARPSRAAAFTELAGALKERLSRLRAPTGKQADPEVGERLQAAKDELRGLLVEIAALRVSVRAAPLAQSIERLLGPLDEEYTLRKRGEGALDFNDLLRRARDLLRDQPDVRAEVRSRFTVLLVDELQDTSPIQAELVELIAGPERSREPEPPALIPSAAEARPGRLFLVGDRKQSIYGFRGADVAAYTALCARMQQAGADAETLAHSRRSQPSLLRFVNALFPRVMQPPAALAQAGGGDAGSSGSDANGWPGWYVRWEDHRDPLHPVRQEEAEVPTVELLQGADAGGDEGEAPAVAAEAEPLVREAELVTRRVLALADAGVRFGDITVLLRRFTHIERYTTALKRAGVPHYVVRGRGFYQATEILDVAALFTLLDDPEDRLALLAVLRSPFCGLSDEALVRLHLGGRHTLLSLLGLRPLHAPAANGDGDSDVEPTLVELGLLPDEAERLERLLAAVRPLLVAGERLGPAACLRAVLDHTDYLAVLAADFDGEQRIANVERLLLRARAFEGQAQEGPSRRGGLRGFVRALRLLTDPQLEAALGERPEEPAAQVLGEADDVVRLMTVHQAKGLEFPTVIVAGCAGTERSDQPLLAYDRAVGLGLSISEEGERTPTLAWLQVQRLGKLRAEAESARLFYVAATRARDRLIFVGESRRRAPKGSWREHLDALLADPVAARAVAPGAPPLLVRWQPGPPPPPRALAEAAPELLPLEQAARQAVARVYDVPERGAAAAGLCLLAAMWTELLVCPRRLRLAEHEPILSLGLGLGPGLGSGLGRRGPERVPARPRLTEEVLALPVAALRESGLLNRLLVHRDPERDGADAEALLAGLGLDLEQGAAAVASLRRLLRSRELRRLLDAAERTRREEGGPPVDWTVRWAVRWTARAGAVRASGVLDALIVHRCPRDGQLLATALDVWDGLAPAVEGPLHGARRRLLALAASALCPQAQRIEVSLCFAREAEPVPPPIPMPAEPLATLGAELGARAALALQTLPVLLELPALPLGDCERIGCEHRALCHGAAPADPRSGREPPG